MMLLPDARELAQSVGTRYALVVAVAKRARMLIDGEPPKVQLDTVSSDKPVSTAVAEIAQGKISVHAI